MQPTNREDLCYDLLLVQYAELTHQLREFLYFYIHFLGALMAISSSPRVYEGRRKGVEEEEQRSLQGIH